MNIDEIIHNAFQEEIDNQPFREPLPEEIAAAMNALKTVPEKKPWGFMTLAAVCLGCLVFALSPQRTFNNMPMSPLAKTITAALPENPKEEFISFVQHVQLGMYSEK